MRLGDVWSDLRYRWRALAHRGDMEAELNDELRFHLEREAERLERAGIPADEAMRRARLAFGGVETVKEESRDNRGTVLFESMMQDLRYAIRGLRAKPTFTIGVVLTLGLGIGANAAMFGIVDRLLFRPPPFLRDPATVHRVYELANRRGQTYTSGGQFARYADIARETKSFSTVAAFAVPDVAVGDGESTRELPVNAASASYWDLFDAKPVLGRFFTASDDRVPVGAPVVVLGYEYWQMQYGGRNDVIGKSLRVGRTLCTIIGVAPQGFRGLSEERAPALYIPLSTFAWDHRGSDVRAGYNYPTDYGWHWVETAARRRPDVTLAAATADLTLAIRKSWARQAKSEAVLRKVLDERRPRGVLEPVQYQRGPDAGPQSKVVMWVSGVALIVLLIACANVANLLLARAMARRREIALRLALGVSRARLTRQLLTESFVLAVLGGIVGLIAAQWGGGSLRALFLPADVTTSLADSRTLVVALLATLLAGIMTGLAPVAQTGRYDLAQSLGAGGRDGGGRSSRARVALLFVQATLSVVLLVGAGLFVRSLRNVRSFHLGFDVTPIVAVTEQLRGGKMLPADQIALEQRLIEDVRSMPGVVSATQSPSVPFWGFEGRAISVPGVDSVDKFGNFFLESGNADFFRTMGTRILRGRAFDDRDGPGSPRVMVVSEGMASVLWPGQDAIGRCVRIGGDTMPCTSVIGVSEEMHIRTLRATNDGEREFTYALPIAQYADGPAGTLLVRVAGNGGDYAEAVRRRLQHLMPGASYVTTMPLQATLDPKVESWKLGSTMFTAFAALALVIAGVGLYGVIGYGVAQRRKEIGVRIALGASRSRVVRLVVGSGLRVVVAGIVAGTAAALWGGRWIASLLFNEPANDPAVYVAVATVLVLVSLLASAIPALRAARLDPNVALRTD